MLAALGFVMAACAAAPGPEAPAPGALVHREAGAPLDAEAGLRAACETHDDCVGLAASLPDAGDPDAGTLRLVGQCVNHACVLAQDVEPSPPLTFEQATARFPDLARHVYPASVLSASWLAGAEEVKLWVDRAQLWSDAAPACTAYVFHRENDRLVAPRPRADDARATLQLSDTARLVGKGVGRAFGRELVIRPDALAYVGARANLVPTCVSDRHVVRIACEVRECPRCERIVFTETPTGGRSRWPVIRVGGLRVEDPSPLCPPCEPGLAAELGAARAAIFGVQALHVTSEGPVFHRTAAGCEKALAERRRQNQP